MDNVNIKSQIAEMKLSHNRANGMPKYSEREMNHWIYTTGVPGANGMHYNTRMEVAPDIANQLMGMDAVQSATVLLSDRNAYIAVTAKDGSDLDRDVNVTSTIARKVRAMRPSIANIYVSAEPYFVQKAALLKNDLVAGKPQSALLGEFNMIVQKVFPAGANSSLH
ncbi:YhcN/YlaJ family sporulation lipoprotein [Paenibacillus ginsengarvi]|nr:YhcN/YlaJ family sporulation lipoprotein [Paenibacillus ginsengarvi]